MSLPRFHDAQESRWGGYQSALAEMRQGRKSSHWIWYIFPQLEGLGRSSTARDYALRDLGEACAYLRDPILRERYEEIAAVVRDQLAGGASVEQVMGGATDALKLVSSVTLFRAAAQRLAEQESSFVHLVRLCDTILEHTAAQSYPPCAFTIDRLASTSGG